MSYVQLIKEIGAGAVITVGIVVALPIAGAVGTITSTGAIAAVIIGGAAGGLDYKNKNSWPMVKAV